MPDMSKARSFEIHAPRAGVSSSIGQDASPRFLASDRTSFAREGRLGPEPSLAPRWRGPELSLAAGRGALRPDNRGLVALSGFGVGSRCGREVLLRRQTVGFGMLRLGRPKQ